MEKILAMLKKTGSSAVFMSDKNERVCYGGNCSGPGVCSPTSNCTNCKCRN